MSLPPLTPWFPAHVKPARPGVYERKSYFRYSYWNGKQWCPSGDRLESVALWKSGASYWQDAPWRGLSREA